LRHSFPFENPFENEAGCFVISCDTSISFERAGLDLRITIGCENTEAWIAFRITASVYIIYGCGAKIIFPQFDTIILTFMYHFPGGEID
jgi:hypothetical protein